MSKSLIVIFLFIISTSSLWSAPSYRVLKLYGTNSLIDEKNEAKVLTQGVYLPTNAKIMVSKGSQLTITSDTGALMHLSEGSALEIWREQLVLLSGTLWVQSSSEEKELSIETMNGVVNFKKSELILSFDDISKKTQTLVISGHASIANIFMKEKKELLVSGEISFIQKDFQQGMPRRATLIGNESLAAVFNKFKGIKPGDENFQSIIGQNNPEQTQENFTTKQEGRSIASSKESGSVGGIYFLPKSFSAPKRLYPIKARAKERSIASIKPVDKNDYSRSIKPIRVFELFKQPHQNSWSKLLGDALNLKDHSPVLRLPSSVVPQKKEHQLQHQPLSSNKNDEDSNPDFESLMKDLKNVSPDHNEVY